MVQVLAMILTLGLCRDIYINIYVYVDSILMNICMSVYGCICIYIHTHTHIYVYAHTHIYMINYCMLLGHTLAKSYIYMCVCVCVYVCVR